MFLHMKKGMRACASLHNRTVPQQNVPYAGTGSSFFTGFFTAPAEGPAGTMVIAFLGHRASHILQPMHFSWSTTCSDRMSPDIALTGQTFAQTSMPTHLAGSMNAFGRAGI
jgi:hypothetical protein